MAAYELWEAEPAPNRGANWDKAQGKDRPYDEDWEQWSYPLGNGYMGACIFGRVDSERIQLTEKTLYNHGMYNLGSITSFAEIHLDLHHDGIRNYRRSLVLDDGLATVSYERDGVRHSREYFMSYPDNVMVIRLAADRTGAVSLVVRPEIPFLGLEDQRTGTVTAQGDLLLLSGCIPHFNCNYEGQVKVLHEGGTLEADEDQGTIAVRGADAVTLLIATGTNYRLSEEIFLRADQDKLDPGLLPHEEVSVCLATAQAKGYDLLKERHLQDHRNLFGRVAIRLNSQPSPDPTHVLLEKYRNGDQNPWLEELLFQYGRYLLIASSRENTLPSGLQGAWSAYHITPWTGGYWHNINVQMNYWGSLSANLAECFEAYIAYFKAYLPMARQHARDHIQRIRTAEVADDVGWIIGTGAGAYKIGGPGGHSGPGTGGFTAKLLVEYCQFTMDREFLEQVGYPAVSSMSRFYSQTLVPQGDLLLVTPSASPEQRVSDPSQVEGMPGHVDDKGYYTTAGCTFDQSFVWENHHDTLVMARALGREDDITATVAQEIGRLDPIHIGSSGQIKEYREEQAYSDVGDPHHRHISHLCPLYPGTLINASTPEWMQAASRTLDLRGNQTTGWAMAHRMNCRARLKEGDKALEVYQRFISERTVPNLWTLHPPFQIDGNLGTMAGVVEMLLQSHEGYIEILPALPRAWSNGFFRGLVARGNFVISAEWKDGKVVSLAITSRSGGSCRVACPGMDQARIVDGRGASLASVARQDGRLSFETVSGATYTITS